MRCEALAMLVDSEPVVEVLSRTAAARKPWNRHVRGSRTASRPGCRPASRSSTCPCLTAAPRPRRRSLATAGACARWRWAATRARRAALCPGAGLPRRRGRVRL